MKTIGLFLVICLMFYACIPQNKEYINLEGEAQGTTFFISYYDSLGTDYSREIEQILRDFDQEVSTYKPNSIINQFNDNQIDTIFVSQYNYLPTCFKLSEEIKAYTLGYFNHGLHNLISLSSQQSKRGKILSKEVRDSLLIISSELLGNERVQYKKDVNAQFNFNALAQGYSVDVISDFLETQEVKNYMVEIGGEVRVKGKNPINKTWTVSLEAPNSMRDERTVQETIELLDKSVVTSGSYRKFKEIEGVKYSHAINPKTGLGVTHRLLSVSVITEKSAIADGLATAFLVMGKEKTIQFLTNDNRYSVSVLFIESDTNGDYQSSFYSGFEEYLVN